MNTKQSQSELDKALDTLANQVEWCIEFTGAIPVNRAREAQAIQEAKQAVTTYINQNYIPREKVKEAIADEKVISFQSSVRNQLRNELRKELEL